MPTFIPYEAGSGDITGDTFVDILDVITLVNGLVNHAEWTEEEQQAVDLNGDGMVSVLDVVQLVNIITDE